MKLKFETSTIWKIGFIFSLFLLLFSIFFLRSFTSSVICTLFSWMMYIFSFGIHKVLIVNKSEIVEQIFIFKKRIRNKPHKYSENTTFNLTDTGSAGEGPQYHLTFDHSEILLFGDYKDIKKSFHKLNRHLENLKQVS